MFAPRAPFSLNSPLAQMPPPNPPTSLECPTFMHAESHWLPSLNPRYTSLLFNPPHSSSVFFILMKCFALAALFMSLIINDRWRRIMNHSNSASSRLFS